MHVVDCALSYLLVCPATVHNTCAFARQVARMTNLSSGGSHYLMLFACSSNREMSTTVGAAIALQSFINIACERARARGHFPEIISRVMQQWRTSKS